MGTMIRCCKCGELFDERALEGSWLERRCPLCGKKLSEETYDKAARGIGKRKKRERDELALARFYTSEWFRLACAGQGSVAADKGLHGLKPRYSADGVFELVPDDENRSPEGGLGVSAEYFVFDSIRAEIAHQKSPLAGSFLVPHLMFPWLPGQKPKQWGAKQRAEVDCVLFTRSCAVVVEVKRRAHHVRVSTDQRHIRERGEGTSYRSSPEPVEQVERGADSVLERQTLYPKDRIFKLVVYVEPQSFTGEAKSFVDGWLTSYLDGSGRAHYIDALCELVSAHEPIASKRAVRTLSERMLQEFGNTVERRRGHILGSQPAETAAKRRRTNAMLDAIEAKTKDKSSPLYGAVLVKNFQCEVQVGKHEKDFQEKQVDVVGLLLTRSFAFLIDAKRWPVHVNTHAPFATVYTGDADEGAEFVEGSIRHDWDIESIHYRNRSGSLTLLKYVARSLEELDRYRESNRVCTLNVFVDPLTFCTDGDTFRQRTYIGFWNSRQDNIISALETQVESAAPIMTQSEIRELINA